MRKVQMKEEKKLKKELDKPEVHKEKENISNLRDDRRKEKKERKPDLDLLPVTWVSSYLPIRQIKNGVIYTTDHRYVKLIEILPINFLLRSSSEQRNIIMSFMSYLKIAPVKIQFKVVSKKADISEYIEKIKEEAEREPDHRVKLLQEDYAKLIERLGRKEAITRRFFMVFEYQSYNNNKNPKEREVLLYMRSVVQTAKKYLSQCGNVVLEYENDTRFLVDVLYQILNRKTSVYETLEERTKKVARYYQRENGRESISYIPVTELIAPETMDMRHRSHLVIDGMYYSYLLIPSHKYRTRVPAGWLSLLINAGEGIDVDVFFFRQDKSKSMERIGRRIRLNRSKIKDTYDTNTDFDDLSESIHAGYYLKRGLSGSEDFYYMSTLITITGYSAKEVEWRVKEMTKLLNSQDIGVISCMFREENAFLSSLPLLYLDKKLYERSKRNVLTSGVASCYPFTSYEMSDKDGIMMGVNKANNSLVIVDIFNTKIYKNANIAILGTSGAGKTFTMQLMALRLRRKNVQVFIIAPDKGHEFARACNNIGGAFIQISPASPNCINVMEIRPTDTSASEILDGYTVERSELAMKIQSLHIFFSLLIPDLSHEEKQLLDEALVITYAEKGITHDNQSLENPDKPGQYKDMPILGDLYEVLLRKRECRRMANILNRLVHGSASTFNQKTNVDLSNKYVVLDISELSGDLLLGMFVALDFVWAKAKEDRTVEKAIFVDEAWKLLVSNELAGEYLLEIFKVIRAYGGSAICATQDLVDFFALKGGKFGRGILNNSKTKIILNMETSEAENIREELDLSEAEAMSITRFERGTGLISTNSNNLIVDFKASQLEKDLITTDRKDLQELKERLQKYGQQAYGKQTT
ncbi:VirB4 family type IV secretion system protein [Coprococcus sp. AF51-11b1]|uniref:VirB4 family type IV secretion system protein n=1 Tax=Coprococcus sp. AF51-11b1 TaxID=2997947 RepID=UPI0022E7896B|nr:DUF87 domain-containing protein [Coprococcus sp. AF51-11b1]